MVSLSSSLDCYRPQHFDAKNGQRFEVNNTLKVEHNVLLLELIAPSI